ncbi:MAG: tetratricopeptide repeat protein [bacterium]
MPSGLTSTRAALLLAAALPLAPAAALAADDEPAIIAEIEQLDQATLDKAETYFFQALAHYRQSRYEAAAVDFQKAFVLTGHRDLLFNVARSRERLGDTDGAVEWYRAYLATSPADETAVIHRIRQLGGEATPAPVDMGRISREVDIDSPLVPEATVDPIPFVALGVGALAAGAGVWFGLTALDEASRARAADTAAQARPLKEDAEQSALYADISFGVAAAAVGAAVVLWALADDGAAAEGRVDVGLAPGGGYIGYGLSF